MRSVKLSLLLSAIFCSSFCFGSDLAKLNGASTTQLESYNFLNWRKNLRISYFGSYSASTLKKWDDNIYDHNGNRTSDPVNLLNEFNTTYRIYGNLNLYMKNEFYYQIGDRRELGEEDDQGLVTMGDVNVGFQYPILRNNKMIFNGRLTHGHPVSNYSKNSQVKSELEYQNFIIWFPTVSSTFLIWNSYRYYVYEAERNDERYRINNRVIWSYSFNDKWGMQLGNEWVMQHRGPKTGSKVKKWNHFEKYKNNYTVGVTYKLFKNLTLIPNIESKNDRDIRWETLQLGVLLLGRVY